MKRLFLFLISVGTLSAQTLYPVLGFGAALPATCGVGQMWSLTNAPAARVWYLCTAANTWTLYNPFLSASITAASSAIANTEAQVVGLSIPANTSAIGTTYHIHAGGNVTTGTSPGNDTFRIRIGTSSLSGNIPVSIAVAANASVTTQPFTMDAWITIRTIGAGGTIIGDILVENGGSLVTGAFTIGGNGAVSTATVAVDTTAVKILELTFQSGAASSSATFQIAQINQEKL